MLYEKRKWLEKTANIIDGIVRKYPYSDALVNLEPKDPLFNDSCHYVGLVHDLQELVTTLRGIVKYGELSEHSPEEV